MRTFKNAIKIQSCLHFMNIFKNFDGIECITKRGFILATYRSHPNFLGALMTEIPGTGNILESLSIKSQKISIFFFLSKKISMTAFF